MNTVQVGWGYDSHHFIKGRPLILGGVRVPFEKGLKGHSDADAVIHAVIDALLGASSLGDIGTLFPDSDPRYKGVSSLRLLSETAQMISKGYCIVHVDVTVLTEEPRLGPYKNSMRVKMARAMTVPVTRVSVKAKTNEKMGFVGRGEGLAAMSVATLQKLSSRKRRRR